VVGSQLEAIASGPTAPDPSTRAQAQEVLEKYLNMSLRGAATRRRGNLIDESDMSLPRSAHNDNHLSSSILHTISSSPETPKPGDPLFERVQNEIVGDNALAVRAAVAQAEQEGFRAVSLGSAWQGEAREVGVILVDKLRIAKKEGQDPVCLIAGGETTVTLQGDGLGGRNQELALAAVAPMAGLKEAMLISLATDGEDGPTDAAGAVVTGDTLARARSLGLDPDDYLARNDAYTFFERLGDLIKTGPTGTNVNDLAFLFRF
jgi:hydroxypyruvate reductase